MGKSCFRYYLQVMLALPFLRAVVASLDRLSLLLENLLLQLGSLCAEHTRKATILQGGFPKTLALPSFVPEWPFNMVYAPPCNSALIYHL